MCYAWLASRSRQRKSPGSSPLQKRKWKRYWNNTQNKKDAWLFQGEPHWKAGDLRDADRRQDGRSEKGRTYRHKYRDLYKELDDTLVHLFIGNILDVCHTPDERLRQFPPDICFLLMCIKYAKDKEAFSRLRELTGTAVVSADTCETIAEYLGEPELLERGAEAEGGRNMCKAIRDLVEDGRNEGRLEGRKEGRNEGIQLAKNVLRMAGEQVPAEEIARKLSITKEEVEQILK